MTDLVAVTRGMEPPPQGAVVIPLSKGLFAIVDEADYLIATFDKWHVMRSRQSRENWYARRSFMNRGQKFIVFLHRTIMLQALSDAPHARIDHVNGIGLDNRRRNLRIATQSQNVANSPMRAPPISGYRGVYETQAGRWAAAIGIDWKRYYLGVFADKLDAARAYDAAALEAFGEFAALNFPQGATA